VKAVDERFGGVDFAHADGVDPDGGSFAVTECDSAEAIFPAAEISLLAYHAIYADWQKDQTCQEISDISQPSKYWVHYLPHEKNYSTEAGPGG